MRADTWSLYRLSEGIRSQAPFMLDLAEGMDRSSRLVAHHVSLVDQRVLLQ